MTVPETVDTTSPRIGTALLEARKRAGFSLDELARQSGVSKSILSQIERDRTNPTLATVWRICAALDHAPEALFRGDAVEKGRGIVAVTANATPEVRSEDGLCRLRILGAIETVESVQWYELAAEPGGVLDSAAHGSGSVEHLTVIEGALTVTANGETRTAGAGETLRYATAEGSHRIVNAGEAPARALMVCTLQ